MAELTKVWFIHKYNGQYHNHSIKGPMVFVNREDAEAAVEDTTKSYKRWSVSSWGVKGKSIKLLEPIAITLKGLAMDSDAEPLLPGAIWLQDLRENQGEVIAKLPQPKKTKVKKTAAKPKTETKAKAETKAKVDTSEVDNLRAQLKDMDINPRNIKNVAKLRRMVEAAYQPA